MTRAWPMPSALLRLQPRFRFSFVVIFICVRAITRILYDP